ncbi:MAG TPA: hypothetical protein EYO51_04510 [Methylococcaceae bacterium]|jgi:hypothetical protein|nr:hypothetical protein [Methylococcaceae bacterium]HIN68214.1 hypothetical protein [Methylococcales bacterium]HIA44438.1 hypothetical protein [Methylococcaceae bacterium]HIB62395.1 hypothetical protein [Methylococcaceae bacterium]HIO11976.1 hypothetical protein [Methylococcales bacterium]
MRKVSQILVLLFSCVFFYGCSVAKPSNIKNICAIFDEQEDWYDYANNAYQRWGSPISVMMSMMYQESSFNADAKPPRTTFLWIFPGPRPTSAFGYAQALDMTWDGYLDKTGRWFADRNDFEDAIDFIGWYNSQSYKHSNVGLNDSYHLYLAYHEGHGGFNRRSFKGKSWLKAAARKVSLRSRQYQRQLNGCEHRFESGWWFF